MSNLTLISSGANSAASGDVPMITIAGVSLPVSSAIVLTAKAAAGTYDTYRRNGSFYQVPVGKKLIIRAVKAWDFSGTSTGHGRFGTSDAGAANAAAAPLGFAYADTGGADDNLFTTAVNSSGEAPIHFEVPAGKYVTMNPGAAASSTMLAELVDI